MNTGQANSIYDQCYIQKQASQSNSKLKYITNNFIDLVRAEQDYNVFSIGIKDGLNVPLNTIPKESELIHSELTNYREKTQMGQLPLPTLPGMFFQNAYGNPEVEATIRGGISVTNQQPCNPRESEFYNRTFPIFNDNIPEPEPIKSVENWQRAGDATRVSFKNVDLRKL